MIQKKTNVYIDGFNLYYGCLRGTTLKWLNLETLCKHLLPASDINKIYYFTAAVKGTKNDPTAPQRQLTYIRALQTLPKVKIIEGHFIVDHIELWREDLSEKVRVIRPKEKASDVNLASMLLWDAHIGDFELAVLVSGDSDFFTPVRMVRHFYKKEIGILDPQRDGTPKSPMNREANFYKPIRQGVLQASQFPNVLRDSKGEFARPQEWY